MSATVVSRGEDCEKLTTGEPLKAVHYALVGTQDKATSVSIEEVLDTIWTEFYDISRTVGVSDEVWLNSKVLITISRVGPQDINGQLLFWRRHLMDNLQWPLNLLNLL